MTKKVSIDKHAQEEMHKALDAYMKDKNSAKEFYPCTQELSTWLQKKEKK